MPQRIIRPLLLAALFAVAASPLFVSKASAGEPVKIIFGVQLASMTPFARAANDFAAMVKEKSNGGMVVEVYTDSVLGNESEMWESIQMGTVDMMVISPAQVSNYVPEYAFYDLPFLFAGYEHRDAVTKSEVAKKMDKMLEEEGDMVTLGQMGGTGRYLLTRGKKVERMADAKGIKMRVQPSNIVVQTWEAFGTVPITIAYGEVYSALQTGVADAAENELSTFITQKWYEPCKFLAVTNHQINMRPVLIGKAKFESLTPEQQQILRECGEAAGWKGVEYERGDEDASFTELKSLGLEIVELQDKDTWIEATAGLREAFCKQHGMTDLLKEVSDLR